MKRILLALVLLSACGGSSTTVVQSDGTAGGEETVPLRTTIPVPVPQPAIAREDMSDALQRYWTQIEETVALRRPDAPAEATEEAVQAWADGPFNEWITARRQAMDAANAVSAEIPDQPPHERAIAAALAGYALEDFAADVRGSPIPDDIRNDQELLDIYLANLREVTQPIARESVTAYGFCQQRLAPLGDESEWLPWRAYCVQRGQELISVYELAPPPEEAPPEEVPSS